MTIVIKSVILFQEAIKAYTDAVDCLDVLCYNPSLDSTSKGLLQKELVRSLRRITCCKYYLSNTKLGKSTQQDLAENKTPDTTVVAKMSDNTRENQVAQANMILEKISDYDKVVVRNVLRSWCAEVPCVRWDDIVGLEYAKRALQEAIVHPTIFEQVI